MFRDALVLQTACFFDSCRTVRVCQQCHSLLTKVSYRAPSNEIRTTLASVQMQVSQLPCKNEQSPPPPPPPHFLFPGARHAVRLRLHEHLGPRWIRQGVVAELAALCFMRPCHDLQVLQVQLKGSNKMFAMKVSQPPPLPCP
jgi:hypothetical protein